MSHRIVIHSTNTTTSAIVLNTGYVKTLPGILKLCQAILGAACVGIAAYKIDEAQAVQSRSPEFFFLLIATSCFIATFCLFVTCFASLTGSLISKTTHEVVYHGIAFVLYIAACVRLIIEVKDRQHNKSYYEPYLAASILGFIVTALYLLSTIVACRS